MEPDSVRSDAFPVEAAHKDLSLDPKTFGFRHKTGDESSVVKCWICLLEGIGSVILFVDLASSHDTVNAKWRDFKAISRSAEACCGSEGGLVSRSTKALPG
jgi:hypothetical protein